MSSQGGPFLSRKSRVADVGGLAALLGFRPAVLASAAFRQRLTPFSPTRVEKPDFDLRWLADQLSLVVSYSTAVVGWLINNPGRD